MWTVAFNKKGETMKQISNKAKKASRIYQRKKAAGFFRRAHRDPLEKVMFRPHKALPKGGILAMLGAMLGGIKG